MAIRAVMSGSRLAYVVVPVEGTVKREVCTFTKDGIVRKLKEQPAGYLVYFPRGHVVRVRDEKALRHYGLHKKPKIINLKGLNDPESPIGRLMASQDEKSRGKAMHTLESQVIALATHKTGRNLMPELVQDVEDEDDFGPRTLKLPKRVSRRQQEQQVEA